MVTGKGDRHAQQRRRRKNNKDTPVLEHEYFLIDGNYSRQPAAYCCYHKGFLTNNQIQLHKCTKRHCDKLKSLEWKFEREGEK